jgi:hypothetical protein
VPRSPTLSCALIFPSYEARPDFSFPFPPHPNEPNSCAAPPPTPSATVVRPRLFRDRFFSSSLLYIINHRPVRAHPRPRPSSASPTPTTVRRQPPRHQQPSAVRRSPIDQRLSWKRRLFRGSLRLLRGCYDSFVEPPTSFVDQRLLRGLFRGRNFYDGQPHQRHEVSASRHPHAHAVSPFLLFKLSQESLFLPRHVAWLLSAPVNF